MVNRHRNAGRANVSGFFRVLAAACAGAALVTPAGGLPDTVTQVQRLVSQRTESSGLSEDLRGQAYLKASNTGVADFFGWSAAVSGDTVVVGADREDSGASGINGDQDDNSATSAGAVYVFTRNGALWSQQAYLKASNADAGDRFGMSIAISGDTLVVGAANEASGATGVDGDQNDNSLTAAGAVYVFTRDGAVWRQQAYLKASNSDALDRFGAAVAISADTIVVGAALEDSNAAGVNGDEDDNSAENTGAAYVFTRAGAQWSQQAYLKASNPGASDLFGTSVAISGDTVVVGASGEDSSASEINGGESDDSAEGAGAAYVFTRVGTRWSQQVYLKASNAEAGDQFGLAAAISGETILVGANGEDSAATSVNGDESDNSAGGAGAAYVFTRTGTQWAQQAYLKASNAESDDGFGAFLSISGEALVIGAYPEDSNATGINGDQSDNSAISAGAAYVFTRSGTVWRQHAYLKAFNAETIDGFGHSVAISGGTVLVGALFEDSNATGLNGDQSDNSAESTGAAYVFDFAPGFTINAGLNDAWIDPDTNGQGFFITVFPDIQKMFLAWFTYETERPPLDVTAILGEPGHRWITALGDYAGDAATLDIEITQGGVFDSPMPVPTQGPGGTIVVKFTGCNAGEVMYDIPSIMRSGTVPIERISLDNVPFCESLDAP